MRIRCGMYLAVIGMLVAACGQPDAAGIASGTQPPATPQSVRNDIANLLQNPPAPGTSVELDAYVWHGWLFGEGSSWTDHDAHGCPILNPATTLLTDKPTPWELDILNSRVSNNSLDYPPDSATWLRTCLP